MLQQTIKTTNKLFVFLIPSTMKFTTSLFLKHTIYTNVGYHTFFFIPEHE